MFRKSVMHRDATLYKDTIRSFFLYNLSVYAISFIRVKLLSYFGEETKKYIIALRF